MRISRLFEGMAVPYHVALMMGRWGCGVKEPGTISEVENHGGSIDAPRAMILQANILLFVQDTPHIEELRNDMMC